MTPRRTHLFLRALATIVAGCLVGLLATSTPPASAAGVDKSRLKHSRLYQTKALTSAGCTPQSTVPLDTAAHLEAYYASVLPCLNQTWKPVLKKAGITFRPAKLLVHSGDVASPCGAPLTISYYCSANRTIYMYAPEIVDPWNGYTDDYSRSLAKLSATHTIAHEYGHHVQNLSGFFKAIGAGYRGATERRAELQASCLGDMFLSSQRDAYPLSSQAAADSQYWRYIEVANHGAVASQQYWIDRGYLTARAKYCNTFKASKSKVS